MTELTLLAVLLLAAALWHGGRRAAEAAYAAAAEACEELRLQLLDDSVSLGRISLGRRNNGWLALRRVYHFDFCTANTERRQGVVVLLGSRVEYVHLGTPGQTVIVPAPASEIRDGGLADPPSATATPPGGQIIPFPNRIHKPGPGKLPP